MLFICQYMIVTVRELSNWQVGTAQGGTVQVQLKKGVMDMLVLALLTLK